MSLEAFVNSGLENKVLRLLIYNNDTDDKKIAEDITTNIAYMTNIGIAKEIFSSLFKQWIIEIIYLNYAKFSECTTKDFLYRELDKRYTKPGQSKVKKAHIKKILDLKYETKNFKPYLEELRNQYYYRSMTEMNHELADKLKEHNNDKKDDPIELAREIEETASSIILSNSTMRLIEEDIFNDVEVDIIELKDRHENPEKYKGIPSGYEKIDKATGGWRPGELILVLGRPGMGKSTLLLNFGYNAYNAYKETGKREMFNVLYVTIEMPLEQQRMRFHSKLTRLDYEKIKMSEYLDDEEITYFENKIRKEKKKHDNYFWFIDAPQNCNSVFIESRITAFQNTTGKKIDVVMVDPIYQMQPMEKTDDPVGAISWDLKLLARKLNVPVLAASQLNRASQKKGKEKSSSKRLDTVDASFSDKLGNNADVIMGIVTEEARSKLEFPKSRDSKINEVYMIRDFNIMEFRIDDEYYTDKENKKEDENNK